MDDRSEERIAELIADRRIDVAGLGLFEWRKVGEAGESAGLRVRFSPEHSGRRMPGWMRIRLRIDDGLAPVWEMSADRSVPSNARPFPSEAAAFALRIARADAAADPLGYAFEIIGAARPEVSAYEESTRRMRDSAHWLANRVMIEEDPEKAAGMMERLGTTRTTLERLEAQFGERTAGLRRILDAVLEWGLDATRRSEPVDDVVSAAIGAPVEHGPSPV